MDRYKFSEDSIAKAKSFVSGKAKTGPAWAKRFKNDLVVKGTKVFYKDREIIPSEKVEDVLRDEIFRKDADIPPSRDGGFHIVKQRYVGISKRKILTFLQAQRTLVETKPIVAQAKVKAGKKLDKYSFETDLIFVKRDDVLRADPKFEKKNLPDLQYIVATTESLTGIVRLTFCKKKDASVVTPIVIKQLREMAKQLHTELSQCDLSSDKGGEFSMKDLKKVVKEYTHVPRGSHIENRNRQAQQNLYRTLAARKAKTLKSALAQAEKLQNNTYNRIQKATPNESADKKLDEVKLEYNKKRKKHQASVKRELDLGDFVRILVRETSKDKLDYKSYKNQNWSKKVFKIIGKSRKAVPKKYRIKLTDAKSDKGKWYLAENLLKSQPTDQKTEEVILKREVSDQLEENKDEEKFEKKRAKEIKADQEKQNVEVAAGKRRKTRKGTRAAQRQGQKKLKQADDELMKERRETQDPEREQVREKMVKKKSTDELTQLKSKRLKDLSLAELKRYAWHLNIPAVGTLRFLYRAVKRAIRRKSVKLV